jgi:hypothetical protein
MYRKLFVTDGGMNIPQFTLICNFLKNGSVQFDENTSDESIERLRLLNYCCSENDCVIHVSFEYKRPLRFVVSFNENDEMVEKYSESSSDDIDILNMDVYDAQDLKKIMK